jgi:hypothetical protein
MRKWIWEKILKRGIGEEVTDIRRTENQMNYIKDMLKKTT